MISYFKRVFAFAFLLALSLANNNVHTAEISKKSLSLTTMQDAVTGLETALDTAKPSNDSIASLKQKIADKPAHTFSEEELQGIIKIMLQYNSSFSQEARLALNEISRFLTSRLCAYKVSGIAFAFDPNGAFIWDNQNSSFTVVFKNSENQIKTRDFDASIDSIGLKIAFSLNFNIIFFTGEINFENSNQVLELGTGIDIDLTFIPKLFGVGALIPGAPFITYAPFKNAPGGFCMLGLAIGLNAGLSMVTGGTLTPKN